MANNQNFYDFNAQDFVSELADALNPPAPIVPYYDAETGLTWQGGYDDYLQNRGSHYDASGDGIVDFTAGGSDWNAAQMTTDFYDMLSQTFPGNINPYTGQTFAETPFEDWSDMGLSNIETFLDVDWMGLREQTSQSLEDLEGQRGPGNYQKFQGTYAGLSGTDTNNNMWNAAVNTRFKL